MGYSHQGPERGLQRKEQLLCFAIDSLRQMYVPVACLFSMLLPSMTEADFVHSTLETSSSLSHSSIVDLQCASVICIGKIIFE